MAPQCRLLKYNLLQPNKIRLLTIEPRLGPQEQSLIICNLKHAVLTKELDYECLSYVWGQVSLSAGEVSASASATIVCNGQRVLVTQHLHDAMMMIRRGRPRVMWIDQLCINQNDTSERNSQIMMMSRIYSYASRVFLFPGIFDGMEDVRALLDTFRPELDNEWENGERAPYLLKSDMKISEGEAREKIMVLDPTRYAQKAIQRFIALPCFRRAWIIQEVALAKELFIIFGQEELPWAKFQNCFSFAISRNFNTFREQRYIMRHYGHIGVMTETRDAFSRKEDIPQLRLLALLSQTRLFDSTDPKDKIYGVLSIASDGIITQPDYSISLEDTYIIAARKIIEHDGNLQVLNEVEFPKHDESFPSWVPDWRVDAAQHSWVNFDNRVPMYRATRRSTARVSPLNDSRKLGLQGVIIDEVAFIQQSIRGDDRGHELWERRAESLFAAKIFLNHQNGKYYPTGESLEIAVARTLVGDEFLKMNEYPPFDKKARDMSFYSQHIHEQDEQNALTSLAVANVKIEAIERAKKDFKYSRYFWSTLLATLNRNRNRRFFICEKGRIGITTSTAKIGDQIALLLGGETAFTLRRVGRGEFTLVGEAYVHGVMDGELFESECSEQKLEEIVIC